LNLPDFSRDESVGTVVRRDVCIALASMARNPATYGYITKSAPNRVLEMALKWFAENATAF
jgi:hypothetical protein